MYKHFVMGLLLAAVVLPGTAGAAVTADSAKISCIKEAVMDREEATEEAWGDFADSTSAAYTARAAALDVAYSKTTVVDVKKFIKTAWNEFKADMKEARADWKKARTTAWETFKTAKKACKAPATIDDTSNASQDAVAS
jgi:hypothetical protein